MDGRIKPGGGCKHAGSERDLAGRFAGSLVLLFRIQQIARRFGCRCGVPHLLATARTPQQPPERKLGYLLGGRGIDPAACSEMRQAPGAGASQPWRGKRGFRSRCPPGRIGKKMWKLWTPWNDATQKVGDRDLLYKGVEGWAAVAPNSSRWGRGA